MLAKHRKPILFCTPSWIYKAGCFIGCTCEAVDEACLVWPAEGAHHFCCCLLAWLYWILVSILILDFNKTCSFLTSAFSLQFMLWPYEPGRSKGATTCLQAQPLHDNFDALYKTLHGCLSAHKVDFKVNSSLTF